jgi:hypothetical protein
MKKETPVRNTGHPATYRELVTDLRDFCRERKRPVTIDMYKAHRQAAGRELTTAEQRVMITLRPGCEDLKVMQIAVGGRVVTTYSI